MIAGCCTVMMQSCVPSSFMANRRVPKFSSNKCAQSSKKTFMCPNFRTNPVLKYTKCRIFTNLSNFLKLCLLYCKKLFALAPTNCRFAEKNRLSGNPDANHPYHKSNILKFSSFELVLIPVLSGTHIESKHFPHVLF